MGKERGNPGRFVPPEPVIRLCLWLLTPGIGCLPLRALVSQKNSDKQHRGKGDWGKRNTHTHTKLSAAAEEGGGHLKYTGRNVGAVLCPSWVPCSLEQDREHHFARLGSSWIGRAWKGRGWHFWPGALGLSEGTETVCCWPHSTWGMLTPEHWGYLLYIQVLLLGPWCRSRV